MCHKNRYAKMTSYQYYVWIFEAKISKGGPLSILTIF
jgi:hypothetical protein